MYKRLDALDQPHQILGLHEKTITLLRPKAEKIYLEVLGEIVEAKKIDEELFCYELKEPIGPLDYRIYHHSGLLAHDPYVFDSTIGDLDLHLFHQGTHDELYKVLGAQQRIENGVEGVRFSLFAPNAEAVFLVADFNHFDGRVNPMRRLKDHQVFELFVPGVQEGEKYRFEIRTKEGYLRIKSDPYAFYSEFRPNTSSIVANPYSFDWKDQAWLEKNRKKRVEPFIIYEVHLGSWLQKSSHDSFFPNYRQLAFELGQYCQKMHFTHVELLPIMEHPLDESWGYQVTGFFSPTSRYGSVADFQFFVDHLHRLGIGVILDWVPAHFPTDDFSLNRFDGTCLYEHEDPRQGIHPHWHTAIFNYGKKEVCNFLLASALFWLDVMHVDGLRVDAVASMLYLDYGRKEGEWIANCDGGNHNLEAISFLKNLNQIVKKRLVGKFMIAEESSSFPKVTHSVEEGGLGFDYKWNMGWMNDTLRYFAKDPIYRKFHHDHLTFPLLYAFSEKFISVLSHDEVVHGKASLLAKMPGSDDQKFANLRLLYSYMICHPGKKLLFMGSEMGMWEEWNCRGEIGWHLLKYPFHQGLQRMVQEINFLAQKRKAFSERDDSLEGFEWIDFSDHEQSIIAYLRKSKEENLLCIHNFTPNCHKNYFLSSSFQKIEEIFNSDTLKYGGSHQVNHEILIEKEGVFLTIAPLATQVFEVLL